MKQNENEQASAFTRWVESQFEERLRELQWAEIARALTALSSDYVHRRERLAKALEGRGKRAAFALYYAPRHFIAVRETVRALEAANATPPTTIVDLGCGTGVAGAAWSAAFALPPSVLGVDTESWMLPEAARTYRALGVPGRAVRSDITRLRWPRGGLGIVAAFTLNELAPAMRTEMRSVLATRIARGDGLLIVEPLATRPTAWLQEWVEAFEPHGGRSDLWRFDVALPERVVALGRSAGLDAGDLGCRSLWIPNR